MRILNFAVADVQRPLILWTGFTIGASYLQSST